MKHLKINPQVYEDLDNIKKYIAEDSIIQADKVILKILDDINNLLAFPEIGTYLSNKILCPRKYRYIMTYSFATIYYLENDDIIVITVLHLSRDFSTLTKIL